MSRNRDQLPVRKVTIQQKVVQPMNTSVATTNNDFDSFRRYPTVVSHDPSGRGHRGKNWAKPTRGVVANIVKDLDQAGGKRKTNDDDPSKTGRKDYIEKNDERSASLYEERKQGGVNKTGARLPPVVPPKPKRQKSEAKSDSSMFKSLEIPREAAVGEQQTKLQKNAKSGAKLDLQRKPSAEERHAVTWENTFKELKEKISERMASKAVTRKPPDGVNMKNKQDGDTKTKNTSDTGKLKNKKPEIAAKTDARQSPKMLKKSREIPFEKPSENTGKSESKTPYGGVRNEGEGRTAQTKDMEINNISGTTNKAAVTKLSEQRKTSGSPSFIEERQLWEKAVRELELTIADKDLVIDNLSKVNRKLSQDIEHYVGTLKDRDRIAGHTQMIPHEQYQVITGDEEGYVKTNDRYGCQGSIEQRDRRVEELQEHMRKNREEYEWILEERESQILALEQKLNEMRQTEERKGRNSLDLSQGSQNVLKILELRKEKGELEKKVNLLEERLKSYEAASENETRARGKQTFHEIPSMLYKFQDGIESKLQENELVVSMLEEKLMRCLENCNKLKELDKNKTQQRRIFEEQFSQEPIQQVQSIPELGDAAVRDVFLRESTPGENKNLRDNTLDYLTPKEPDICTTDNSSSTEMTSLAQNLKTLKDELQKEKMINENLMERFLEVEELNNDYLNSIKSLESKTEDVDSLQVRNEELRAQNEGLLGRLSEIAEKFDTHGDEISGERSRLVQSSLESKESKIQELQEKLDEDEALIEELREKVVEDEELIEEIRANCQREEKWNREMQRSYEWELNSSAKKDDRIEEFQDCLWAREKIVRELQEQLDFEDKRCEELLEKLIVSQKEAEDFQEICKDLRKKLEDSEKRIREFCDQNDKDAVTISNLTSENKNLRLDNDNLKKSKRNLEEDLERVNGCLEAVEADKENFLTRQETEVKKLSDDLEDKQFTSKGKDEVIEKLQENVLLLSADVQKMEFQMEEGRLTLEEEIKKSRDELKKRDKHLAEALEKYKELQEVCKCLRETISEKEGDVLDREATIAHQREILEGYEKEIERLRRICDDNPTPLNDKPELVYTESEMEEVNDFLEQERVLSEILRKQISFLENEVSEIKESFDKSTAVVEERTKALESARNEIKEHESRQEETSKELGDTNEKLTSTNEELCIANTELARVREELISSQQSVDESNTKVTLLQVDLTALNTKYQLLEALEENNENELVAAKQKLEKLYKEMEELKHENERMRQREESVGDVRMQVIDVSDQNEIEREQVVTDDNSLHQDELSYQSLTERSEVDGEINPTMVNQLQSEQNVPELEVVVSNEDLLLSEVYQNEREGQSVERADLDNSGLDFDNKQQLINELQNETQSLISELDELRQERRQILEKRDKLKISVKELQALNETVSCENKELKHQVETLTDKWLESEQKLREAQATNVNLRYTLEEYVSQSQAQIRHLKNHEREVATLTEHIHDMDVLVQGFKTSLQEVVEREKKSVEDTVEGVQKLEGESDLKENGTQSEPRETPGLRNNTLATVLPEKIVKNNKIKERESDSQKSETASLGCASAEGNTSDAVSAQTSNDDDTTPTSQTALEFLKKIYRKIFAVKIPENVILVLIFLILVFSLGCTNIPIISRKYLFVFANTFITLIFFALWVNELHKNKKYKAVEMFSGQKDRNKSSQVTLPCDNCGGGVTIQCDEIYRYAKIRSSFQELHEKFLEAVENSSKDTMPIQELYEKYEKLKEYVEDMRTERLQMNMMNSEPENDEISRNDSPLSPKWNKAATILGKSLVITLLCEVLYIRGLYFLPNAVNLFSYVLSLIAFSYFYETICVETTKHEEPCATTREMELEHEINELNHIIEKEHELVTTQREAMKVLEKRLRKEFEKRIKQRNILLKKLKYKGKLEDLKELLDTDEHDERKGITESLNNGEGNNNNQRLGPVINGNNNPLMDKAGKQGTHGLTGVSKVQQGFTSMEAEENTMRHQEINSKENHVTKELQEIISSAEKESLDLGFVFSPMFFFLGLPLTAILLSCRYIALPVLMMAIQAFIIVKETNFIKVEGLPKVLQKNINPIVLDTIVVLYACMLAIFLQCTQSIVVMITCALVQLGVHWWTSYRLAKRDDTLQEISTNCLPIVENKS
ncbi:sporulation-specific protein 15-like [Dendronephthya gigantea]|uniref:sporulation-specific protein 15-like n=1 Tax=Dendronephthya gigantea TaxID=151771 RepID=UPI00106C7A54|nr:sporulation-specific protein 15-like [Dendronephthya gigantea]